MSRRSLRLHARRRASITYIAYPTGANIINIKRDYGAVGDGVTDDTAAIQAALDDHAWVDADLTHSQIGRSSPRIIYFPPGTYRVSDTLYCRGSSLCLAGAGRSLTIIKLADNATGFTSAGTRKVLLRTGNAGSADLPNSGFSNYVRDLTIDIGLGNVGATGLLYNAANCARIDRITIKSSDTTKRGARGLELDGPAGPCMVADLVVDGFDYGIYVDNNTKVNNVVFSGADVSNCLVAAVRIGDANLQMEGLTTANVPKAINCADEGAFVVVVDSTLAGTSGAAITTDTVAPGQLFLRNVAVSGFTNVVTLGTATRLIGVTSVGEWSPHDYILGGASPAAYTDSTAPITADLPGTRSPDYAQSSPTSWVSVASFGAVGDGVTDDTAAIQAAIDSGAEVVYFPYATYVVQGEVFLRSNLYRLVGCFSQIDNASGLGKFTCAAGTAATVWLEDLGCGAIEQNSSRTFVVRNISAPKVGDGTPNFTTGASATGDWFIENTGPRATLTIDQPINVWTRQINREVAGADISNGATVRVFGDNVEQDTGDPVAPAFVVSGGATVDFLGGCYDILDPLTVTPAPFQCQDATLSMVLGTAVDSGATVDSWLTDVDGTTTIADLGPGEVWTETGTPATFRVVIGPYMSAGFVDIDPSIVQSATRALTGTSTTVTLGSAPTAGNMIVMIAGTSATGDQSAMAMTNAGFTRAVFAGAASGGISIFYKEADGTEGTAFTATFGTSGPTRCKVIEVDPGTHTWAASPVTATDTVTGSNTSSDLTAAAPSAGASFAIAAFHVNTSQTFGAWDGGFVSDGADQDRLAVATKYSTAAETFSTNFSWSASANYRGALAALLFD